MPVLRFILFSLLSALGLQIGVAAEPASGNVAPGVQKPAPVPDAASQRKTGAERALQFQESEDALHRFTPKKARSADEEKQRDALAWYLTGRLRHERHEFTKAMEAFERAIELHPSSSETLRALIATAIELKQNDKAIEYALKAIELNSEDYALLRMVGTYLAGRPGRLAQAVDLLERAAQSATIRKRSSYYVTLMRDLAAFHLLNEQPEKAADCYDVVFDARIHPDKFDIDSRTREDLAKDRTTSFQHIGQVFTAAKRYQKAISAYEQALEERKGRAGPVSYDLAQAYFMDGQPDKALQQLQSYFDLQLQSKGSGAYQLLADILQRLNKADELVSRLEALAKADLRNSTLQNFLAEQYLKADRLKDAEELYKKTLAGSNDPQGRIGLASVYRRMNRPEDLLQHLAQVLASEDSTQKHANELEAELKAIAADQKLLDGLFAVGQRRVEKKDDGLDFGASYLLARLAVQVRRTPEVQRFYRHALAQQNPPQRLAVLYEQFGGYMQEQKEYAQSVSVFREAFQSPALALVKSYFALRLSQSLEWNGETDAALDVIAGARKEQDSSRLHLQEGWICYHSGKMDRAIQLFEEVIQKYENHEEEQIRNIVRQCKFSLSNVYIQQGDMQKGEAILEKILADDPDDTQVNNDLGYLWADQGKNLDQAEKMIRKAIAADPENAAYLDSMGWVLFRRGKFQEAAEYLDNATKHSDGNGDSVIWEHLGDCYEQLKRLDQARQAWQKSLDLARKETKPDQKLLERVEKKLK